MFTVSSLPELKEPHAGGEWKGPALALWSEQETTQPLRFLELICYGSMT